MNNGQWGDTAIACGCDPGPEPWIYHSQSRDCVRMNQEMLCTWLSVPKTAWPPDPWTLLGLTRGEHDLGAIEERVQDRMTKLRHYQLSYPEEATEGMNRLAEAFVTLAEACSKRPAAEVSPSTAKASANGAAKSKDDTSLIAQTKVDCRA